MIDRSSEQIVATSNKDSTIKTLYRVLSSKYKLSENDIELYINIYISVIYVNPQAFENYYEFEQLKSYCRGFVDGFEKSS